jgi:hypothetical protein
MIDDVVDEVHEVQQDAPTPDKLMAAYIKIRDSRNESKREYEVRDEEYVGQLRLLEASLLETCKTLGADSIKTRAGTAIRTIKSKYWTGDWDSMYNFIRENDAFLLLEKRLHQTNMRQFLDENPDIKPAGLNIDSEYAVTVRRSKN